MCTKVGVKHQSSSSSSTSRDSFRNILAIRETFKCIDDTRLSLPGYHQLMMRYRDDGARGGVGIFIREDINFKIREDIGVFTPHIFESICITIINPNGKNTVMGLIYRPNTEPRVDIDIFSPTLFDI